MATDEDFIAPDNGKPVDLQGPNVGEQAQVDALKLLEAEKMDQRRSDLAVMLAIPEGRRVLWWLIEQGNTLNSTFSESHAIMAHREGKREAAIELITHLESMHVETFPQLMLDGHKDRLLDKKIQLQRIMDAAKRKN